ncbi:hypothetical protein M1E03_05985 [Bacillus sp. PK6-013]
MKVFREEISAHQPDIIAVNEGYNQYFEAGSPVIMKEDSAGSSRPIDFQTYAREELKSFIQEKGMSSPLVCLCRMMEYMTD